MAVNQSPIAAKASPPKLPPDDEPSELPALQDSPISELVAKAPNRHKLRLRMLEEMPKGGKCAEIGVWNGGFSRAILEVTNPSELVLIDPWDLLSQQPEEEHTHRKHDQSDEMLAMYDNVVSTYGKMSNVSIVKGFSAEVLSNYPDDYFDWVYIDGNHLYEFVRKDVEISLRKVRPEGLWLEMISFGKGLTGCSSVKPFWMLCTNKVLMGGRKEWASNS